MIRSQVTFICFLYTEKYTIYLGHKQSPVAKFLVPDWGIYVVDNGIGLSYWPTRLHWLPGQYTKPYARVDYILQSGTENLATVPPPFLSFVL